MKDETKLMFALLGLGVFAAIAKKKNKNKIAGIEYSIPGRISTLERSIQNAIKYIQQIQMYPTL